MRYQCNTCGGKYDDVGADGVPYFHACPPVTLVTATFDDNTTREQPLRAYAGLTIADSEKTKADHVKDGKPAREVVVERSRREAPRKDARDENTLRRDGDDGKIRVLKSEGKGRTAIAPRPPVDDAVDDAI